MAPKGMMFAPIPSEARTYFEMQVIDHFRDNFLSLFSNESPWKKTLHMKLVFI